MLALPATGLRAGERVCVAISGGADSTALLLLVHAANSLPRNSLGVGLSAVHVHHGLRGAEADDDQRFVEALCERLEVPLHVRAVDTAARVRAHRETTEEAARMLRYQIFESLLNGGQAQVILTAHTLDDQAETVLMKVLRGAWTEGLSGIAPELPLAEGRVLRPLLGMRRAALRDSLKETGQSWREDSTNQDEAFTRNRLRQTVLPLLEKENPQLTQALANMAELAREEEARWQRELDRLLPQLLLPGKPVRGGGRSNSTAPGAQALAIELDRLRPLDPALRRRVVRAAAERLGCRLTFAETARLLTLAGFTSSEPPDPTVPAKVGGRLTLSGGLLAERSARELRLSFTANKSER